MRRRSKLHQCLDVLEAISGGPLQPTIIGRKTGLPWDVLKDILDGFVHLGYLTTEKVGMRKAYRMTKKGHRAYIKLGEVAREFGPLLEPIPIQGPIPSRDKILTRGPSR